MDISKYDTEIKKKLEELIVTLSKNKNSSDADTNFEIEYRIKSPFDKTFIDSTLFDSVLNELIFYTEDVSKAGIDVWKRLTPIEGLFDTVDLFENDGQIKTSGTTEEKSIKTKLESLKIDEYSINIGFAIEKRVQQLPGDSKSTGRRSRKRHSFELSVNNKPTLRVDLTEVTQNRMSYEIEIEMITPKLSELVKTFNSAKDKTEEVVSLILRLVNRTKVLYDRDARKNITKSIIETFEARSRNKTNKLVTKISQEVTTKDEKFRIDSIANPVDLLKQDIQSGTPGSLFPNVSSGKTSDPVEYMVTIKADGERILIFWSEYGTVLFNPRSDLINLLDEEVVVELEGAMLDGELLPLQNGHTLSKEFIVLVFDCLFTIQDVNGKNIPVDLRNRDLVYRLVGRKYVVDTFVNINRDNANNMLFLYSKIHFPFNSRDTFFAANAKAWNNRDATLSFGNELRLIRYENDGLIYTSTGPYLARFKRGRKFVSKNRKWKPLHQLTIDFKFGTDYNGEEALQVLYRETRANSKYNKNKTEDDKLANSDQKLKTFEGTGKIDPDNLPGKRFIKTFKDKDGKVMQILQNQIVECAWSPEKKYFYPVRIRSDKNTSNNSDQAEEIWTLINDPIPIGLLLNDLKGRKVLDLMRKFTNRVKEERLMKAKFTSSKGKKEQLLLFDIGSGNGGDIDKWQKYNYNVVALEPNRINAAEFERRANIKHFKYSLLIGGGQDNENVVSHFETLGLGKADVVTMMHVLTFFYDSADTVNNLIKTIKGVIAKNGRFICMAMDGKMIHNQLGENMRLDIPKDNPAISIRRVPDETGRKIWIRIAANLLAEGQEEYLVDFDDFISRMERNGFELLEDNHLNAEAVLGDIELWWLQMSRVIEFRYVGDNKEEKKVQSKLDHLAMLLGKANINQSLPVDKTLMFPKSREGIFNQFDLFTVGVLGGGSCFLHSTVYAVNNEYKTDTNNKRIETVLCLRDDLGEVFTGDEYAKLGGGEIMKLGGDLEYLNGDPSLSYGTLKDGLIDYAYSFGLEFVEFVCDKIDINIHIVWIRGGKLQVYKFNNETIFNSERHNIIIYWQGGVHFQPVGLKKDNDSYFVFRTDDPLIQTILNAE